MRLKLYEDAIRAKTKTTTKGDKTIDPDDSDELTAPGGLRDFISRMSNVMFPRAAEEARELFRAGQRQGALARQGGESMLSHVSRRRRWWKLLKSLDDSIELSEPMRVELVFELSGLNRQESLVIKACTSNAKSFEAVSATLVEHYSGVHLKEGRSLGRGGTFQDRRHPPSSNGNRSRAGSKVLPTAPTSPKMRRSLHTTTRIRRRTRKQKSTTTPRNLSLGTKQTSSRTPTPQRRRRKTRVTRISSSTKTRP